MTSTAEHTESSPLKDMEPITTGKVEENFDLLEEEEEEAFFQDIDLLTEHGIKIEDIVEMRKIGLNTVKGVQMTMRQQMLQINGFTKEKIEMIKEACNKVDRNNGFITALEVCEERKHVFKLTTGSCNLDKLLGGGVESMSVTEVFGEARTGKTQIAHTLCVTAQLPGNMGYRGGKVMFIDTEHSFRPDRIRDIAIRFGVEPTKVLENILYARAHTSEHQYELLKRVANKFHEEPGVFKLLIVDSIVALFRVEFSGIGEITNRQQKLGQMMSRLQKISEEFNVAVFITNQITTEFKYTLLDAGMPKPTGGNILAHASTTRIALKKVIGSTRSATVYDSPDLEETMETFVITSGGIKDPNPEK